MFPYQGFSSLSVTKIQYERVDRVRFTRDATDVAAQGIIARFIDILDIVQLTAGDGLLGRLDHHLVLIIPCLHIFVHFPISLAKLIDSSIKFSFTLTTGLRLVPALGVS